MKRAYRYCLYAFLLLVALLISVNPPATWVLAWRLWIHSDGKMLKTLTQARVEMESQPFSWWVVAPAMNSTNDWVKLEAAAIRNLIAPEDKRASALLFALAGDERKDGNVRAHCLDLLSRSTCPTMEVMDTLRQLMISDADPFVRICAFGELFDSSLDDQVPSHEQARKVILSAIERCEYPETKAQAIRLLSHAAVSWYAGAHDK